MTASTSFRSTRPRRMPRTPVAIRAAGKDKNVIQARFRNIVRRMSTPTAIFFAVNPPPSPIASTRVARSEDPETSMSSTLRWSRSRFRIPAESWVRDKRIWSPTGPLYPSECRLRLSDETAESLPHADRTAPSEGVAAITATAPSIVLEGDPSGSADIADARTRFLDSAVAAFVLDLRLESPRGLFRIPSEREAGEIVALGQDILCLPEQCPDLRRIEVVRFGFLEDRFARDENRASFLDLRLAKLDRPFNLLLLALHREPFGPFEQVARMAMLARGNRLSGRGMKLLGFPHLRADIPGEFDVARYGPDRILHVPNPARPGVVRALGGFQEALPCRPETTPVQEVGPALPCVLRESDRRTEVRGLANRVPRQGQMVADPFRLSGVGTLRRADEIPQHGVVDR